MCGYPGGRDRLSYSSSGYRLLLYQSYNAHKRELVLPFVNVHFGFPDWDVSVSNLPHNTLVFTCT